MNGHNQNKESSYLMYWDGNNLYILLMSQKLAVNNFTQKITNQCLIKVLKNYIKNYIKIVTKDYN